MDFAVLGCSLDALDAEEKVAMKLAYLGALREGILGDSVARDPYDLLVGPLSALEGVTVAGRMEIESWLTPRPAATEAEKVEPGHYREFIDTDGCAVVSARLREFVKARVLPLRPMLVGVDHSLTCGVLEALRSGGVEPGLVVVDSHLDAVPVSVRTTASGQAEGAEEINGEEPPESYNCGTWLASAIERRLVDP